MGRFTVIHILVAFVIYQNALGQLKPLTVEKIMRDSKWIGVSPSNIYWSEDSKSIYFNWNPDNNPGDSLYSYSIGSKATVKVSPEARKKLPSRNGSYDKSWSRKVYVKNGDLFLFDIETNHETQITNTLDRISSPVFIMNDTRVAFTLNNNLYTWEISSGKIQQHTDFKSGTKRPEKGKNEQDKWLNEDQLAYFKILKERKEKQELRKEVNERLQSERPIKIYLNGYNVRNIKFGGNSKYISYTLRKSASSAKRTIVPTYVTESGYSEDLNARSKVGSPTLEQKIGIYDVENDSAYIISTDDLSGIEDKPDYYQDYPELSKKKNSKRKVFSHGPFWSEDGLHAALVFRADDNKDRWIGILDFTTGKPDILDRQRDDAWVAGPGISWSAFSSGIIGWMPDNKSIYYQSEETGYSHLYTVNIETGKKKALTSGKFEIYNPRISKDKKSWYFESNEVDPGERHLYKMPIKGGKVTKLTSVSGRSDAILSPDETKIAIRYSSSNKPWELYLMDNEPGTVWHQITNSSSDEFESYPWREPEYITFNASDGAMVRARLYRPENPENNGPAVIFVHGAGYLQNAHKWWSSYFREYMFHNLLADNGYTILDIDYRGSAGYGRDWRTGIYRFMGGLDLSDQVDGAKFLAEQYQINPARIGMYGGSYGGFITLMAMFTKPGVFASGAALRSVTDWAHYNHPYTSNILNTPVLDSIAYAKSSPIYYAEGLEGNLLICHGMVDTNVHFQDVVRLAQRLIELGKDNWELAIYPLEKHGFVEPSSWTDEYKRIFKLFEETLK